MHLGMLLIASDVSDVSGGAAAAVAAEGDRSVTGQGRAAERSAPRSLGASRHSVTPGTPGLHLLHPRTTTTHAQACTLPWAFPACLALACLSADSDGGVFAPPRLNGHEGAVDVYAAQANGGRYFSTKRAG